MPYRPLGNRSKCYKTSVCVSDATVDLLNECKRRAKLLGDDHATNDVLHAALRLLIRAQDRAGIRAGVDLSRPLLTGADDIAGLNGDEASSNDGFRGAPRPPTY